MIDDLYNQTVIAGSLVRLDLKRSRWRRKGMTPLMNGKCQPDPLRALSPREKEILPLVAQGLDNRQIGKILFISEKTAKNYITSIRKKLGLANRTQIALFAIREGLIEVNPKESS
jgi:DNA-binding NarL/FixJ family response regulator